jgi:hypothetical protein
MVPGSRSYIDDVIFIIANIIILVFALGKKFLLKALE